MRAVPRPTRNPSTSYVTSIPKWNPGPASGPRSLKQGRSVPNVDCEPEGIANCARHKAARHFVCPACVRSFASTRIGWQTCRRRGSRPVSTRFADLLCPRFSIVAAAGIFLRDLEKKGVCEGLCRERCLHDGVCLTTVTGPKGP